MPRLVRAHPAVDLRVYTETLSDVAERVLEGSVSRWAWWGRLGMASGLVRQLLGSVRMVPVVAPSRRWRSCAAPCPSRPFADYVQVVLSERHDDGVPDQAVLSGRTWRVVDLATKHALLRGGLGWGNLPHLVEADLKARRLVAIHPSA